jgi:hypothetical protein
MGNKMTKVFIFILPLFLMLSCEKYLERSVHSPTVDGRMATFRYKSESAMTVQVVGDFNNWGYGDSGSGEVLVGLMEYIKKDSVWQKEMELSPGRHFYYFLVNETERILDPNNPRVINLREGEKASLLIMP